MNWNNIYIYIYTLYTYILYYIKISYIFFLVVSTIYPIATLLFYVIPIFLLKLKIIIFSKPLQDKD